MFGAEPDDGTRSVDGGLRHFDHRGRTYRLDLTALDPLFGLAPEQREWRVSVRRAAEAGPRDSDLPFGLIDSAGAVEPAERLDSPAAVAAPDVERWEEVARWQLVRDGAAWTSSYEVGRDRMRLSFPPGWFEPGADLRRPPIGVEVNGVVAWLRWPLADDRPDVDAAELDLVVESLDDRRRFFDGLLGLRWLFGAAVAEHREPVAGSGRCAGACLGCASGLAAVAATNIALVTSCGGTLVSGGSTLALCVTAFIAHESAMLTAMARCGSCNECVSSGGGGTDCCTCRGEPLCDCETECRPTPAPPPDTTPSVP
ncbi:MAG: hypothetical protein GWN07_27565 [Actinobacteria bacterium]|nr:hypothetical protein [Actinomycetota bacterium]NIU69137.1 hypothetical protein [Actinomycetota bacterium]NIW30991.1 hypothetical protein [Actinomycetota bacterium]NIX23380.1 hypothetical protein [Actinomycetota bacterium]